MLCVPGLCVANKGMPRRRWEFQHRAALMLHRVPDADNLLVGRDFDACPIAVTVGGLAPAGERVARSWRPILLILQALRAAASADRRSHVKLSHATAPWAP